MANIEQNSASGFQAKLSPIELGSLGRHWRDSSVVSGGARGGVSAVAEHVDVAQVQVLVLQDSAQLLKDVPPRGV